MSSQLTCTTDDLIVFEPDLTIHSRYLDALDNPPATSRTSTNAERHGTPQVAIPNVVHLSPRLRSGNFRAHESYQGFDVPSDGEPEDNPGNAGGHSSTRVDGLETVLPGLLAGEF